jgi:NAD/NADP transhydrogenase beta subunit
MSHRFFRVLAMLWVGSQLSIGYMAAPVLFAMLERSAAGAVAAQLFRIEGMLGVACALVMLLIANRHVRGSFADYKRVRWIVAAMLLCVAIGYFALQPFMNSMLVAAREAGMALADSPYAKHFGILHAVSTVFYVVESVLGLMLIWRLPGHFSTHTVVPKGKTAGVAARRARG